MKLDDRRRAVMSVLDDAAKTAGIPRDLLGGIWHIESTCGSGLSSGTGSEGDFQFLASTFAGEIKQNGSKIATRLRATGHADLATAVENYQRGLKNGTVSESDSGLQNLRYDPYVSTYAGALLAAENAHIAGVDPYNKAEWGVIYAGYNVGPTNARKLRHDYYDTSDSGARLGKAARVNPAFYQNHATGAEALACYQAKLSEHVDKFVKQFANGAPSTDYTTAPTRTAPVKSSSTSTTTPVYASTNTRTSSGTQPDYFEDVVGHYLGDGQVHKYKDTIVKYGICQSANPDVDVAHLTREQALQIYRDRYWNSLHGIHDMSRDDAAAAFRMSYRHGATYANSHLDVATTATNTESTAPQSMRTSFQTSSALPKTESLAVKFFRAAETELRNFFTLPTSTPAFSFT